MQPRLSIILLSLLSLAMASPVASPDPAPIPDPDLFGAVGGTVSAVNTDIVKPILNLAALSPPTFLQTFKPSPECANINQGQMMCCRATLAGDMQPVVFLAQLYGYSLNANDVNGIDCDNNTATCPGVNLCCQTTFMVCLLLPQTLGGQLRSY
jgi:hypothetical protein